MPARPRRLCTRLHDSGYLRFAVTLVVTAAAFPFLAGDDCYTPYVEFSLQIDGTTPGAPPLQIAAITGTTGPVAPSGFVSRQYNIPPPPVPPASSPSSTSESPLGGPAIIRYWPPTGAQSVSFTGLQPENSQGPPPFVFPDLALGTPTEILAHYNAPPLPANRARFDVADMFTVTQENGNVQAWLHYTTVTDEPIPASPAPEPPLTWPATGRPEDASRQAVAAAIEPYSWWRPEFWFGLNGVTMTTDLCNATNDYFQGGLFFVAARLPITGAAPNVPIAFRYAEPGRYPRLDLLDYSTRPTTVRTTLPLVLRQEWLEWAENALPRADGEHWTVLAPSPTAPATCQAGLGTASWEYYSAVPIDAGANASAWNEKVLRSYLCFVGTVAPPFVPAAATLLGLVTATAAPPPPLVTALGPFPIRLPANPPDPPFFVHGAGLRGVLPPAHLEVMFRVENPTSQAASATMSARSKLKLPWRVYNGSWSAPNLGSPITGPVTLQGHNGLAVWLVADAPAGVAGAETLTLTATSPANGHSTWNTGVIWFGGWPHVGHPVSRRLRGQ